MAKNIILSRKLKQLTFFATVLIVSLALGNFVFAVWDTPTAAPPGGNVSEPINVSSTAQVKSGNLSVDRLYSAALYDITDPTYFIDLDAAISGVFAGKVGISTVPDFANFKINMKNSIAEGLHISRTAFGANSYLNIENEFGSPIFRVHENGSVEIGTSTPDPEAFLHVYGDSGNEVLIESPASAALALKTKSGNANEESSARIVYSNEENDDYFWIEDTDIDGAGTPEKILSAKRNGAEYYVGISVKKPTEKLEVDGGVKLKTSKPRPGCNINIRGTFWFVQKDFGEKDSVGVCARDNFGNYAWRTIY